MQKESTKNCPSPSPSQNEIICQSILHWFGATRFCTSKYLKSIFFTYFHKPPAGSSLPRPTRPSPAILRPVCLSCACVCADSRRRRKNLPEKFNFWKIFANFIHCARPFKFPAFVLLSLRDAAKKGKSKRMGKERQKNEETPKEINGNKGQNSAAQRSIARFQPGREPAASPAAERVLLLAPPPFHPFIFGTFARAQGPFVILRRQQEIALRCLSFSFFSRCFFRRSKNGKNAPLLFLLLICF